MWYVIIPIVVVLLLRVIFELLSVCSELRYIIKQSRFFLLAISGRTQKGKVQFTRYDDVGIPLRRVEQFLECFGNLDMAWTRDNFVMVKLLTYISRGVFANKQVIVFSEGILHEIASIQEQIESLSQPEAEKTKIILIQLHERITEVVKATQKFIENPDTSIFANVDYEGTRRLRDTCREAYARFGSTLAELAVRFKVDEKQDGSNMLDEIDEKIIETYQEAEKQNLRMPGSRKIAKALYISGITPKKYSHEGIQKRIRKLRKNGLIGHPDDTKDSANRCTPQQIEDMDADGKLKEKY